MRKIAVFARGLMMSVCVLLTMTACSEEELVAPEENGGADNNTTITTPTDVPMKTIRISAGMAQGEDGEMTRTTLNGQKVLWDANDQFVVSNGYTNAVKIVLNQNASGVGAVTTLTNSSTNANIRYSDIKIFIDGEDVARSLMSPSNELQNSKHNELKIGINNAVNNDGYYKLPEPGVTFRTKTKGGNDGYKLTIPIIRVSSSSPIDFSNGKTVTVIINDPEYQNGTTSSLEWIAINDRSQLLNGSEWKAPNDAESIEVYHGMVKNALTLDDTPGFTYGVFSGKVPANSTVDEYTRAVYPTKAFKSYTGGNLTIDIPEIQEYVENSFDNEANIMVGDVKVAEGDNYNATFKNMMGILKLSLKGTGSISAITITDRAGKNLWGTATIDASKFEDGISTDNISGGNATLTMNCNNVTLTEEAKDFYFVVPVGSFQSGFEIGIETNTDGGQVYHDQFQTLSKNNVISRNGILEMPTITVDNYEIFNVENPILTQYLDMGPYSKWGASTYFSGNLAEDCVDKDYPASKNITWTGSNSGQYTVTLTDLTNKKDVFTNRTVTGTSYEFINLVPDHKYTYTVKNGDEPIANGKFLAKGRVRMIRVDDTWNFRDMGGWTGLEGYKVQYEWLYRCGSLNGESKIGTGAISGSNNNQKRDKIADPNNYEFFTEKSRQQLIDLGIKGELDLRAIRTEENITSYYTHSYSINTPHTGIEGWNFKRIMFNDARTNPKSNTAAIKCMAWIIDEVVNKNHPVAFHCKSGADRTGNVAYLIHSLLGVSEGDLALDFEMTNFSHEQKVVLGTSEIRAKYTSQNTSGFFSQTTTVAPGTTTTSFMSMPESNRQRKAYYYLNQFFVKDKKISGMAISSTDLDKFIAKMLGMKSYTQPGGVETNNTLESIYK